MHELDFIFPFIEVIIIFDRIKNLKICNWLIEQLIYWFIDSFWLVDWSLNALFSNKKVPKNLFAWKVKN